MYSGEVAVAQTQFPGLMEAANWLGIRGLCTEEETEEEEVEGSREEVTVTTNGTRKRQHSDESEEEEEEEQILGPDEDQVEVNPSPGKQLKQQTYGAIQGVNNAVWMMKPDEKQEEERKGREEEKNERKSEEKVPDLVRVAGPPVTAPPPNLSPSSLNEQLLQVTPNRFERNYSALCVRRCSCAQILTSTHWQPCRSLETTLTSHLPTPPSPASPPPPSRAPPPRQPHP